MLLQMAKFHSFLWLNNIPLCVCLCVCVCVCVCVYGHIFLDISSITLNLLQFTSVLPSARFPKPFLQPFYSSCWAFTISLPQRDFQGRKNRRLLKTRALLIWGDDAKYPQKGRGGRQRDALKGEAREGRQVFVPGKGKVRQLLKSRMSVPLIIPTPRRGQDSEGEGCLVHLTGLTLGRCSPALAKLPFMSETQK